jgi:hypothetical protein
MNTAHSKIFRSKLLSRNAKFKIYETLIWHVPIYGTEAIQAAEDVNAAKQIEIKIYGPMK